MAWDDQALVAAITCWSLLVCAAGGWTIWYPARTTTSPPPLLCAEGGAIA